MLIEVLHPILIDQRVVCDSFRLNIVPSARQARCKIMVPAGSENAKPSLIDLVVYEYTTPKLSGLSVAVDIRGAEQVTNTQFNGRAMYDIMSKSCKFNGNLGLQTFSFSCSTVVEAIEKFTQLLKPATNVNPRIVVTPNSINNYRR